MTFDEWWDYWGSSITSRSGADMGSHARRVAREAWDAGLRVNDEAQRLPR